jgi:Phosphotransferase enzyme family/HicA toxin of bacterial toxin-antitoxin,
VILSLENLVYYLLERGCITRESVVNGGIEISEIARRNRNFRVKQRNGQSYFLKQVRRWEPEALRTLHAEAQCYKFAAENETFADAAEIVPHFHSYDQRRAVLITELLDGAETITEHHFSNESFPVNVAEKLGRVFGNYHRKASMNPPASLDGLFPRRPAWALSLHDMPPHTVTNLSGGVYEMLGMVRQFPQFGTVLDKLRTEWRFDVLIHGDIKWGNCVLCARSNGDFRLKIVDWEMADWGDSCWDLVVRTLLLKPVHGSNRQRVKCRSLKTMLNGSKPWRLRQPACRFRFPISLWRTSFVHLKDRRARPTAPGQRQAPLLAGLRPDFRETSARELVRALEKVGFDVIRQKGSHMTLHNPETDKTTLVAMQV